MEKFFLFVRKIHVYLLFVLLEVLAIGYYRGSSMYADATILTYSKGVTSRAERIIGDVSSFINLREENRILSQHIAELESQVEAYRSTLKTLKADTTIVDSVIQAGRYQFTPVSVIGNSVVKLHNFITIDKGHKQGIEEKMALISGGNILGYVVGVSDNFAVAISILNIDFKTSGKIKNREFYGSIFWDGVASESVTLAEIPKYAEIAVGDTITTTTYSSIFPSDLNIGIVREFELINGTYYTAKIDLTQPMGRLENVIAVKYLDRQERDALMEQYQVSY